LGSTDEKENFKKSNQAKRKITPEVIPYKIEFKMFTGCLFAFFQNDKEDERGRGKPGGGAMVCKFVKLRLRRKIQTHGEWGKKEDGEKKKKKNGERGKSGEKKKKDHSHRRPLQGKEKSEDRNPQYLGGRVTQSHVWTDWRVSWGKKRQKGRLARQSVSEENLMMLSQKESGKRTRIREKEKVGENEKEAKGPGGLVCNGIHH